MARTKQQPPNSSSTRGQRLRNISAALTAWGKFYGPGVEKAARRSDEAKYAARTAMTLMLADLALLNECRAGYGCRHDLEIAFNCLADAATWPSDRDKGDCPKWGEEFTQPKLWDGQKWSFINEVNRWANSVDEEQIRSRYRPDEPGRSLAMKVPSVDSANGAADTPADLAKDIADILESGGPHLHVKDHDAPPETRYDERTMRILLGSILNRYNELCKSYPLPPLQIDASDPFVCLGEIQRLLAIRAEGQTPRYVFQSEGATWRIIYERHERTVDDSLGMKYIRYLLEHPNTSIECRDIERACSGASPEGGRRMDSGEAIDAGLHTGQFDLKQLENWDAEDIKSALNKLKADIEDTDDPTRKTRLQKDADDLAEYLRKNLNKHGRPRSADEREKARSRVQKAINAAKRAIKHADEEIGNHFDAVRGEGTTYTYKPSSKVPWASE